MKRLGWLLIFAVVLLLALIVYRGCRKVPEAPPSPPVQQVTPPGGVICGTPGAPLSFCIFEGCRCRCTGSCATDPNLAQYACSDDHTCHDPDQLPGAWCGAIFTCQM